MVRLKRPPRVLMLGWEYPPRFAGGLGKACQGLSQAMSRAGAEVFFVLPTFPERISEPHLEVVGAREVLLEAGWQPRQIDELQAGQGKTVSMSVNSGITLIRTEASLYPYGAAPEGPVTEKLRAFIGSQSTRVEVSSGSPDAAGSDPTERVVAERAAPPQAAAAPSPASKSQSGGEIYGKNLWSEIERYTFSVRQLAFSHEVDCVHAHDWMTFPAAFEFARITGVPVFLHVHATEYDRSGENVHSEVFRIEREGFRRATHVFCVSRYTAGIVEKLYGIPRKKVSVAYNAPEEDIKQLIALPESAREPNVIFLGRLTFQKGPDHFLRACAQVAQADSTARFVFCGTGDMMDKLRHMAFELGIESRVHFAGFVDPGGVDEILKKSRVLVMPSVSEPFGLVALEAIHCGIPVILSKQSGVREVLMRALQVDFWDHEKLADQILAALRLPELGRQLVSEGMEQVQSLSWDKTARTVLDSYRKHIQPTRGDLHGH